jgi:hypothetical protein
MKEKGGRYNKYFMEREAHEEEVKDFVLEEKELQLPEVHSFGPLVLLIQNVTVVQTLKIWSSSDFISRQYSFVNGEMRVLDRSFEIGQSWDFYFGDVELRIAPQKTFKG